MRSRKGSGFSLIELLVVIAIIAVLAGILFPVLARARANARSTQCLNSLHQLGKALRMYIADNHGYFPTWCSTHPNPMSPPTPRNAPADHVTTWDKSLRDYVEGWQQVVTCPNNPNPASVMGTGAEARTARAYAIARYTQRRVGANFVGGYAEMVVNPAETVLLFEKGANLPGSWGDALGENVYQTHDSKGQAGYREDMFHKNGKNFLFVDGNVKWHPEGQGPFAWDSGREGCDNCGPGVCELWGTPDKGGDWPPLR